MRRASLVAAIAACAAALALPTGASALTSSQIFGIGDQATLPEPLEGEPAFADIFADPRLKALKPKATRYIADYKVAQTPSRDRERLDAWYQLGLKYKLRMLIAFTDFGKKTPPDMNKYRRGLVAFHKRYPAIKEWAPINEANHSTQSTYRRPQVAVRMVKVARSVCSSCTLVQLTLVLGFESDIRYARDFMDLLPKSERKRMVWGLHTYSDTNRNSSKHLTAFLKRFPTGGVWFTESAAWAQFAPPTWPYSLTRQANRTALVFRQALAASKRVKRLYWYEWDGDTNRDARWDSGLVDGNGKVRPAYKVALAERFRTKLTAFQKKQMGLSVVSQIASHKP